jgi:hypothetical protein
MATMTPADIALLAQMAGLRFPKEDMPALAEALVEHLAFVEPLLCADLDMAHRPWPMTHAGQTERGVLDLDTLTIARARNLLQKRQLGAVELIEATLRRIDQTEPLVHAYVQVLAETKRRCSALVTRTSRPRRGIGSGLRCAGLTSVEHGTRPTPPGALPGATEERSRPAVNQGGQCHARSQSPSIPRR